MVPIGGVCSSAYLLTSGHMRNGDGAEWEMGRVRRPLLADWPKRDAMLMLNSAHARARHERAKNAASRVSGWSEGVVVVVSDDVKKILSIK